jgi:hypothetical protein
MINSQNNIESPFDGVLDAGGAQVVPDKGLPRDVSEAPYGDFAPKSALSTKEAERLAKLAATRKIIEDRKKVNAEVLVAQGKVNAFRMQKEQKIKEAKSLSWEGQLQKIDDAVVRMAKKQRDIDLLPVGLDGRIKMEEYAKNSIYGQGVVGADVNSDRYLSEKKEINEEDSGIGRVAEKFIYSFFGEILPDCEFVRTADFDDKHIDGDRLDALLAVDGKVTCAFDIACTNNDDIANRKKAKALKQNMDGGARIKYSFEIADNEMKLKPETNIPILTLAFNRAEITNGVRCFNSTDILAKNALAKKVLNSLRDQIAELRGYEIRFDPRFGGRAAYNQRIDNLDKKFADIIAEIEAMG